jgi:hypothetical protein
MPVMIEFVIPQKLYKYIWFPMQVKRSNKILDSRQSTPKLRRRHTYSSPKPIIELVCVLFGATNWYSSKSPL